MDLARALGVTFLWGLNFSLIKVCLTWFDPFTLSGIRFLLCALPLIFFVPRPDVSPIWVVAYGLCFGIGTWGLVNWGVQSGSAPGVSSIVLQTSALFSAVFGIVLFAERPTPGKMIGLLVAAIGLGILFRLQDGSVTVEGVALVIAGAFFMGVANSLVKAAAPRRHLSFLAWSSLISPLPLFALGYLQFGGVPLVPVAEAKTLAIVCACLLISSYLATLYSYYVWNRLIHRYELSQVAPLSLVVPVFGITISHFVFAEPFGGDKLLACVLVMLGLLIAGLLDRYLDRYAACQGQS